MREYKWLWISLLAVMAAIVVILLGCEQHDYITDPQFAKGGNKGAPEIVIDSVTVIPADTTIAPGDSVQFHALIWVSGEPYIHCPEYGVAIPYAGDREACASYVPKGRGRYKT